MRVLTPVGGAPEMSSRLQTMLEHEFGAVGIKENRDMVFRIPSSLMYVQEIALEFTTEYFRERSAKREFVEELGPEEWDILSDDQLQTYSEVSSGFFMNYTLTMHPGREGEATFRLIEVFDAQVSDAAMEELQREASGDRKAVQFVTREEIMAGVAVSGDVIADVSRSVLDPLSALGPNEVKVLFETEPMLMA